MCQQLKAGQGAACFVQVARQQHEGNCCVLSVWAGSQTVAVGTSRYSGMTAVRAGLLAAGLQEQQGKLAELNVEFRTGTLVESDLQEDNGMAKCVMWWNDCFG